MPPSVRAHLATQTDSASLENLAMLAVRAVAAEKDVDEAKPGVAEINISESGTLVVLLEDLSRRLKKLETAKATQKKAYKQPRIVPLRHSSFRMCKPNRLYLLIKLLLGKMFPQITKKDSRPNAPPSQNNVAQPIDTADASVCFYHQPFGDRART